MPRAALRIQDKIEKGWRKEAGKLGQLWDIERNGVKVLSNYLGIIHRYEGVDLVEMDTVSFSYRLRGPRKKLQIGDFLVGKELASKRQMTTMSERYLLVTMRLHTDNIIVRCNRRIQIYRPTQLAGFDATTDYNFLTILNSPSLARDRQTNQWQFLDNGGNLGPGMGLGSPPLGGDPLGGGDALITDYFDFSIWAGITFGRTGDYDPRTPLPYGTPNMGWVISTQLFPGVVLREADMIEDNDGNWYRVDRPYRQEDSAFLYQLRCTLVRTST